MTVPLIRSDDVTLLVERFDQADAMPAPGAVVRFSWSPGTAAPTSLFCWHSPMAATSDEALTA